VNDNQLSAFLAVTVPAVVHRIAKQMQIDETTATEKFYQSKVYEALSDEKTKAWHFSANTLFAMFQEEQATGDFQWPEEAF
jgi:hypothetical protein